ncbi:paraquat-inducible protein A [Neptunomonas antarctica]|uniref:Paraquat-inducible protein A n=1 Tax=Neptunomonas antarctica TaxID=619304 RepID=A0A1N7PA86_9GAMM|nr:paraquat-inducible protein A [Neptunomonas antarctica]SIT07458.1 paraquat-inducible protein A [Neptunomonas antarctica]
MSNKEITSIQPDKFWVCPECDLLLNRCAIPDKHEAHCSRCGSTLISSKHHSIEWTLALAIAGLILFFPANLFPILTLKTLGLSQSETIFSSVKALYDSNLLMVAALVLMAAIIIPLMKILLMLYLSTCLLLHKPAPMLAWAMRSYQQLDSWGMLEIYMLGILVSIVKLIDVADVTPGVGLYSLTGLIIATLLSSTQLDPHRFWRRIEQLEKR